MPLPIRPTVKRPVREPLIEAGHNVSAWNTTQDGRDVAKPIDNISRNTAWSFLGRDGEPIVACIWFEGLTLSDEEVFYEGSERAYSHHAFKKLA